MELAGTRILRGPNIWAAFPVLEAKVRLGEFRGSSSRTIPGFIGRLTAWIPSLAERQAGASQPSAFAEQLRQGIGLAHVLQHLILELQSLAGTCVHFGRTRAIASEPGLYQVAAEYQQEELARACLSAARELCLAASFEGRIFDAEAELKRLRQLEYDHRLGPSTAAVVQAAQARGIPACPFNPRDSRMVALGQGIRLHRIFAAETDRTSALADAISQDKELTKSLLRNAGVPVSQGRAVKDAEDAWEAACSIGLPVVVKPRDGDLGEGVSLHLTSRDQVLAAFAAARAISSEVLVEKFARGVHHRLLVIGNQLVAAVRRDPPQVVGDGTHTVAELVEESNRSPRRSSDHSAALRKILFDETAVAVLEEQGYRPESVPPPGMRVLIRRHSHIRDGGTVTDVTGQVAPEVAARAIDAARVIGLDVAGLDVMAEDIGRPLEEQGGVIVEVNARPGLNVHLERWTGTCRPVGEAIVALMFPPEETGRIPIAAVTGTRGRSATAGLIAFLLSRTGRTAGMSCTGGLSISGRWAVTGDCSGFAGARAVLMNPLVEAAILETARESILTEGLGFDRCDAAVVTGIGQDRGAPEELAEAERTVVKVVKPDGAAILNADDTLAVALAEHCPGAVIYFAREGGGPVIARHRAEGGRAVFVRNGSILLAEGDREAPLIRLDQIPKFADQMGIQAESVLAAAAACLALGLAEDALANGLSLPGILDAGLEAEVRRATDSR